MIESSKNNYCIKILSSLYSLKTEAIQKTKEAKIKQKFIKKEAKKYQQWIMKQRTT